MLRVNVAVQLLKNVLNLSFELLITLLHEVLKYLRHTKLFGLLSQLLTSEDRVQCSVNISTHLEILVLHEVVEDIEQLNVRLLTLVLSCISKGQVHQQSGGVLDRVVCQLVSFVSKHSRDPLYQVKLNHDCLRLPSQRELLQGSKCILAQMGIALFVLQNTHKSFYQVCLLEEVASAQTFITECVDKCHSVFEYTTVPLEQHLVDDLLFFTCFVVAIKQVVMRVSIDHLFLGPLSASLGKAPPERLQGGTYFHCLVRV